MLMYLIVGWIILASLPFLNSKASRQAWLNNTPTHIHPGALCSKHKQHRAPSRGHSVPVLLVFFGGQLPASMRRPTFFVSMLKMELTSALFWDIAGGGQEILLEAQTEELEEGRMSHSALLKMGSHSPGTALGNKRQAPRSFLPPLCLAYICKGLPTAAFISSMLNLNSDQS